MLVDFPPRDAPPRPAAGRARRSRRGHLMPSARTRVASVAALALALTGAVGTTLGTQGAAAAAGDRADPAVTQRLALQAGLQAGAKHATRPRVRVAGRSYPAANPFLAELRT